MAAGATVGEKWFQEKVSSDIARIFPRAEGILHQKEQNVSQVVEVTFPEAFDDMTKLDIKSIDDSLRIWETRNKLILFRGRKNKMFRENLNISML